MRIVVNLSLTRSFGKIIYDIADDTSGVLYVKKIRNLEKLFIKRKKLYLFIEFLENCQAHNVFPKNLTTCIPHIKYTDLKVIRKNVLRNVLLKLMSEKRKLDDELENMCQEIRLQCSSGLTWFLIYKAIIYSVNKNDSKVQKRYERSLHVKGKRVFLRV